MGYGQGGYGGGGGFGGQKFEPKPGNGSLFPKRDKRTSQAPDWDGYFIADRVYQPGEKIKLVGWDKASNQGQFVTLKVGREPQQNAQGGFPGQGGYNNAPQQQAPQGQNSYGPTGFQVPVQQPYQQPMQQARPYQPPTAQQQTYLPTPTTHLPTPTRDPGPPPDRQAPPPQYEDLPF